MVTSGEFKHPKTQKVEKGGTLMQIKNNTVVPQLTKINWRNLFLVGLHLFVLVGSALSQQFVTTKVTARALPQILL